MEKICHVCEQPFEAALEETFSCGRDCPQHLGGEIFCSLLHCDWGHDEQAGAKKEEKSWQN